MRLRFKIAANTFVQILGKLISSGSTFLITVLVARRFGVTGFGEFVKITTYVSLFYLVVDFGLNATVLRELENEKLKSKNYQELHSYSSSEVETSTESRSSRQARTIAESVNLNYFSNLLCLRVVFALILVFLALTILVFLPFNPFTLEGFTPLSKLGIIILVPTILTQAVFTSANAVFQKKLRYDLSVLASSVGSLITLALVFLLLKTNPPLLLVIGSYLIGGLVMAVIALYFSQLTISSQQLTIKLWRRLLLKSLPLGLTLIFNLIYFKADTLILAVFRPTSEVGIYGLAKSFFEFPLAIPTFFMNAIYPILVEHKNKTTEQLNNLIKKSFNILLFGSLVITLFGWLTAPYLTLIKPDFEPSVLVFRILSLYLPVFFLSSLFMWTLIAFGKQKLLVLIYGNAMIINILLNLFLIPRFGPLVAVVILGLSELIVLGLTGGFCLELLKKGNNK